ncbi:MAG: sulfatase-like hydrolase/transferase, partial [Pseudomonadales bacterium]
MSRFKVVVGLSVFVLAFTLSSQGALAKLNPAARTNILWISIDDQSPWYRTYGDTRVQTPNIDALASQGVVFERAYAPSPVCSPTRSAIITGAYSIRTGTHDHRSGRVPSYQIHLPEGVTTVPEIFRKAGYTTYNGGKDDFNFAYDRSDLYSIVEGFSFERNQYNQASGTLPEQAITNGKNNAATTKSQPAKGKSALERGDQSWKGPAGVGDWRDVTGGSAFFGQMSVAGGKGIKNLESRLRSLGYTPVKPADVRVP